MSGLGDEEISALGEVQVSKSAEALLDVPVARVMCSPRQRCVDTAMRVAKLQLLGTGVQPEVEELPELDNFNPGSW